MMKDETITNQASKKIASALSSRPIFVAFRHTVLDFSFCIIMHFLTSSLKKRLEHQKLDYDAETIIKNLENWTSGQGKYCLLRVTVNV